jgi:hydroxyacylglutathione hydrolase
MEISALRLARYPTVPSSVGAEAATNPFLRPHDPAIRKAIGAAPGASDVEVFAQLRKMKDSF